MTVDNHIFYTCSHFLSVSERKSRINSFSISNLLICLSLLTSSYCNCVNLLNCWMDGGGLVPSFRGLPLGMISIPAASLHWFLLYLVLKSCTCSLVKPNISAISLKLFPYSQSSIISLSYILICLYSLGINIPLMATIRGRFCDWQKLVIVVYSFWVMNMPRQARKKSESGIYHVMLRGINQQQIFEDSEDCDKFIQILQECKAVSGFKLFAYCLMGNHIHLLIKPEKTAWTGFQENLRTVCILVQC